MRIGTGILLLVVGGILAFAVRDSWDVVDLTVVGYVCLLAGALTLILSLVVANQRQTSTRRNVVEHYDERTPPPPATTY